MDLMIVLTSLCVGVIVGVVVWVVVRRNSTATIADQQQQIASLMCDKAALEARNQLLEQTIEQSAVQREEQERRRKEEQEQLQSVMRLEFANVADKIFSEKSDSFKKSNREGIELLLQPFRENIEAFRKRVEEVYINESQQRTSLKEQIRQLTEMNNRMSIEAGNLVEALKGNSKVQGDWGEKYLETMLNNSGLCKGIHYFTQENFKDEQGANLRPDVVLCLPEDKRIIIDCKVSIKAYMNMLKAQDKEQESIALAEHLISIKRHVDELSKKQYADLLKDKSPDMVIMFIPNEPAFMVALQNDDDLWRYAYEKRVLISSPTNLFAILKIVDDIWKRDNQSRNAIEIAMESGRLYDKFMGFAENLAAVGRSIENANNSYNQAIGQLKSGRGNIISRVERLRKLGVKASKELPAKFVDYDDEDQDDLLTE